MCTIRTRYMRKHQNTKNICKVTHDNMDEHLKWSHQLLLSVIKANCVKLLQSVQSSRTLSV